MGFGDKLKGLKDQAQQAVAENKDKIQGAVQVVGEAANVKTRGKYATKIAKVGEKVNDGVEKFATEGSAEPSDPAAAPSANEPVAPATGSVTAEPAASYTSEPAGSPAEPAASPPEFE